MKTLSNLDNQKELEAFLEILSPSVKIRVTNHIFGQAILQNEIFCDKKHIVEGVIDYVQPRLIFPEDQIVMMGARDKLIYFIAHGELEVSVQTHLKQKRVQRRL